MYWIVIFFYTVLITVIYYLIYVDDSTYTMLE